MINKIKITGTNKENLLSIILYTDKHPYIKKCLRDNDYWHALSERSGVNWNIYSVKPKQGDYYYPKSEYNPNVITMNMMFEIWEEPSDNKPLIELLGLSDTKDLPLIYFFKLSDNEIIVDEICIKIEGNTEQEVYNDLEKIIEKISKSIGDDQYSFDDVKKTIKTTKIVRIVKRTAKVLSDLNSLIPSII